jgi:hypothetical protein
VTTTSTTKNKTYNNHHHENRMPQKKACPVVRVPVVQNLVTHKGFPFNSHSSKNKERVMNLTRASHELFRRTPDECFPSLDVLIHHCQWQKDQSREIWQPPKEIGTKSVGLDRLMLSTGEGQTYQMNDWSFSQLCRLAGVSKETVNRLSPDTAAHVFSETLPRGNKPLQLFAQGEQLRSIHAASYQRLHNSEVLSVVQEFATDFQPPPKGFNGATGLYGGEQDMFCFLIDPTGWTEINGEAFSPGFFLWNSEVGSRSVGIESFWFQSCCQNHIVWDAVEIVEFTRKHTANVHDALGEIRRIIEALVLKRDARRDMFARVIEKAMKTELGTEAEEVQKILSQNGITRTLAKEAISIAQTQGRMTIFAVVDALTRIAGKIVNAGDRVEVDHKAGRLLALAA